MLMAENLDLSEKAIVVISKASEIIFMNDMAKEILDLNDDNEYRLPVITELKWSRFFHQVRTQNYALFKRVKNSLHEVIQKVEGYYNSQLETIIVSFTAHRQEQDSTAREMLEFLEMGVVCIREDGYIVDCNAYAALLLGQTRDQILFEQIHQLKKHFSYNKAELEQMMHRVMKGHEGSITIKRSLKTTTYYEVKIRYNDPQKLYFLSITENQKQLQGQPCLKQMGLIGASVAHEIRNPLTVLRGFTDLLKWDATVQQLQYINIMDQEFHRLDALLSELLYLSSPKTEENQLLDLKVVVKEIVDFMQIESMKRNIMIQMEASATEKYIVMGSIVRLKQVLINLVKNAIQAMQQGTILIRLTQCKNSVLLAIEDEGCGMSEEVCANIFTPFYTTKESGTGLGLPLVQKIMEEYNGTIRVESELNTGTTFYLTFPTRVLVGNI